MTFHLPNVLLRGGPDNVCGDRRVRHAGDPDATYKLAVGHAYEHFRPTREIVFREGQPLRVFQWVRRTYVAE